MWLQTLASELLITLADGSVWLSVGQGLLFGGVCLAFGVWASRFVGLLSVDAPVGETLGVGLASGLLVLTTWWAAIMSGGRSAFTPVAVGFAVAVVLVAVARWTPARIRSLRPGTGTGGGSDVVVPIASTSRARHNLLKAFLCGATFVIVIALLYGSTLIQSPREGVQPLEFMDEAYYSVLGQDLAKAGTETTYSPAGFDSIEGLPSQTWYHWGEVWLTSAAITIFGTTPLDARHLIVLPWLLLATAALTGTMVRRINETSSRSAYVFGFAALLSLAPVPVLQAGHFSSWAVGMIFGITMYGLAAVAALLAMYALIVLSKRRPGFALSAFSGAVAASILPAHVVIAALALLGIGTVWAVEIARSALVTRRLPPVTRIWRQTFAVAAILLLATVAWGAFTGHGIANGAPSPGVSPFNDAWRDAILTVILGGGAFVAIGIAWIAARRDHALEAQLYLGTVVLLIVGALLWGARLADFNTFHLFYGGIAVFATPVAAVAVWSIWLRLRSTTHRRLALGLLVIALVQVEAGIVFGIGRLEKFGPGPLPPVSENLLMRIRDLPSNAKLAYACQPIEEQAFWVAQLLSVQARTGRTVVPMCFQAEFFARLLGVPVSAEVQSPQFEEAPQRTLYPNAQARPSPTQISSFLKANGVGYIYADTMHPNDLVPDAVVVATDGQTTVLQIP